MTSVVERRHFYVPHQSDRPHGSKANVDPQHDLPILAVQENPRVPLPWQSLMDDGIMPALLLGAERRIAGGR